jgi:hypothetical protein
MGMRRQEGGVRRGGTKRPAGGGQHIEDLAFDVAAGLARDLREDTFADRRPIGAN